MTDRPRLRVTFSWTLAGTVTYAACQWGMLVLLAKLGTSATVGEYAYALALAAPVFQFTNLQLRGIQATEVTSRVPFHVFLVLRLLLSSVGLVIVCGLAATYAKASVAAVVVAVGLSKAVESICDIIYGFFQRQERMDLVARSMILRGMLGFAALALGIALNGLLLGAVLVAVAWLVVLLLHDLPRIPVLRGDSQADPAAGSDASTLFTLARLALPLGLVMLLLSLTSNVPRYVIEHHGGVASLGIFAALAYFVMAGTTVINALGQAASPRLAASYAAGDAGVFRSLLKKLITVALVIGAAGIVAAASAGRPLLTLVYGQEYAQAAPVFLWIMVAGTISYINSLLGYALTAARSFRIQPPLAAVEFLVVVAASLLLIPRFHLAGAAFTLLAAALAKMALFSCAVAYALQPRARSPRRKTPPACQPT